MELKTKIKNAIDTIDKKILFEHKKLFILLGLSVLTASLSTIPIPLGITTIMFVIIPIMSFKTAKNVKEYLLFRNRLVLMLKNLEK